MLGTSNFRKVLCCSILALIWVQVFSAFASAADLKPEDVIARHLDSVGTAEARAAVKSRVAQGPAHFKVLIGGAGVLDGKAAVVSEGHELNFLLKILNGDYRGEQFICDGNKVKVATTTASQSKSILAVFMYSQDVALKEGLIGGTLSTAWPLFDLEKRKPKFNYVGLKKFDGREVHDLRYLPNRGSDLEIHLYFDAQTFQHVGTSYLLDVAPEAGRSVTESAQQKEIRYHLEEHFSDFQAVEGGLNLPRQYDLQFTRELQNGNTTVFEWTAEFDSISNNISLDPRNFSVK